MADISALLEAHVLPMLPTCITLIVLLVAARMTYSLVMSRFYMAKPNEWMLVLQNGELAQSGIGMSCFCPLGAQVVCFPSTMQETSFTASQ
eukprot:SAG11_NODE_10037_length_861_cov_1.622047_1_plen_90_part_10